MNTTRRRTRAALAAAALVAPLLLASCSGADGAPDRTPEEHLAAAKAALDDTSGVHIRLSTEKLPKGVNGLLSAEGIGTHGPAFDGGIKVASAGITADAAVIAVDGVVYAKLPFTTKFEEVDPADYGAPDPADLMSSEGGLSSLLTAAEGVEAGDPVRDGDVVLSKFTGTVPGDAVAAIIPSASASKDFAASFTLDDSDRLDQVVLTGPFYPGADEVTYTVSFDQYGVDKDIKAP
jgi:lipoprotein LprG